MAIPSKLILGFISLCAFVAALLPMDLKRGFNIATREVDPTTGEPACRSEARWQSIVENITSLSLKAVATDKPGVTAYPWVSLRLQTSHECNAVYFALKYADNVGSKLIAFVSGSEQKDEQSGKMMWELDNEALKNATSTVGCGNLGGVLVGEPGMIKDEKGVAALRERIAAVREILSKPGKDSMCPGTRVGHEETYDGWTLAAVKPEEMFKDIDFAMMSPFPDAKTRDLAVPTMLDRFKQEFKVLTDAAKSNNSNAASAIYIGNLGWRMPDNLTDKAAIKAEQARIQEFYEEFWCGKTQIGSFWWASTAQIYPAGSPAAVGAAGPENNPPKLRCPAK